MGDALQHAALLFAAPARRAELEDMLAGRVLPDYRKMLEDDDDRARSNVALILAEAECLIELATSEGAAVFPRATLDDLSVASTSHALLIYFGHSRGALLAAEDLADFDGWRARVRSYADHPVFGALDGCDSAREAAIELNTIIVRGSLLPLLPPKVGEALADNKAMVQTIGRDMVDEAFMGLIQPGNKVEMFDGLHAPGRFVDAISPDFCGEMDLTMCHSIAVAAMLDIRRGGGVHHVHWPVSITPLDQFLLVAEALRRLVANSAGTPPAKPPSYISIRMDLHRKLLEGDRNDSE